MSSKREAPEAQRVLMIGWNARAPIVIRELDDFSEPGSDLVVVADLPEAGEIIQDRVTSGLRTWR